MVPLSGGETVYLKAGFGDFVSFIFSWLRAVVLGPTRWLIYQIDEVVIYSQSCAFLAVVSGQYLLLIHSDIHQALEIHGLTVVWAEKIVAVGLMGRYLYKVRQIETSPPPQSCLLPSTWPPLEEQQWSR